MIASGPCDLLRRALPLQVAAVLALSITPAIAQTLGKGEDDGISLWRVVAVLLLCLALAVFAAYALRARMGGGGLRLFSGAATGRRLRLIETARLSHQIDLCIVACDGSEMLVAASAAHGVQVLRQLPAGAQDASQTGPRA